MFTFGVFLVHIFLYSDWIRKNTDQKQRRIWTLPHSVNMANLFFKKDSLCLMHRFFLLLFVLFFLMLFSYYTTKKVFSLSPLIYMLLNKNNRHKCFSFINFIDFIDGIWFYWLILSLSLPHLIPDLLQIFCLTHMKMLSSFEISMEMEKFRDGGSTFKNNTRRDGISRNH